jgi:cytochrome-b5 reductase
MSLRPLCLRHLKARLPTRSASYWLGGSSSSGFHTTAGVLNTKPLSAALTGDPICALAEPGTCQFTYAPTAVPLLDRTPISKTSCLLRFGLPDANAPLRLSTCACIVAHATIGNESVSRPYTPISTNAHVGTFDLLVKHYPNGTMSPYLCHVVQVGDTVEFTHTSANVKVQAPFTEQVIGLLVGGAGITPMLQLLHACLGASAKKGGDGPKITMLYGSTTRDDILGKELLKQWERDYDNFELLVHVLSDEPKGTEWRGRRGYFTKEIVTLFLPSPEHPSVKLFVCGPPAMYEDLCGPRNEERIGGELGYLGYKKHQVYKF